MEVIINIMVTSTNGRSQYYYPFEWYFIVYEALTCIISFSHSQFLGAIQHYHPHFLSEFIPFINVLKTHLGTYQNISRKETVEFSRTWTLITASFCLQR